MNVINQEIEGVKILESSVVSDDRGEFSRIFCDNELSSLLNGKAIKQINRSVTRRVGAIRGLHFQNYPHVEIKIVRCLKGRIFDVAVDLRKNSTTFLKWIGVELCPRKNNALVIPEGCAHGFQVLEEDSELLYLHTAPYTPSAEGAVCFNDPLIGISWPLTPTDISKRDLSHSYLIKDFKGMSE